MVSISEVNVYARDFHLWGEFTVLGTSGNVWRHFWLLQLGHDGATVL